MLIGMKTLQRWGGGGRDGNVLKLTVDMAAQLSTHPRKH